MKISSTSEPLRPDRVLPTGGDARTAAPQAATPVAETERVQVSDMAARLAQLESQFGTADFDVKRVEEVRSAMAEGRFKVNTEAVADKLLASVAELLGKKA
jgi:negative regulator of flagellin synthesis FlgM